MGRPLPASKSARTRLKLASSQSLVRRALLRHPCRMHVTTTDPRSLVSLSHAPVIASPPNVASPDRGDIQRRIRRPPCMSQVKSRATEPAGRDAPGSELRSPTEPAVRSGILDLTPLTCAKNASTIVGLSSLLIPDRLAPPLRCTLRPLRRSSYSTSVGRTASTASAWRDPFCEVCEYLLASRRESHRILVVGAVGHDRGSAVDPPVVRDPRQLGRRRGAKTGDGPIAGRSVTKDSRCGTDGTRGRRSQTQAVWDRWNAKNPAECFRVSSRPTKDCAGVGPEDGVSRTALQSRPLGRCSRSGCATRCIEGCGLSLSRQGVGS